jgi:hypothetical protein
MAEAASLVLKRMLAERIGRDCASIVDAYLKPLPPLPFIEELLGSTAFITRDLIYKRYYDYSVIYTYDGQHFPCWYHARGPEKIARILHLNYSHSRGDLMIHWTIVYNNTGGHLFPVGSYQRSILFSVF